MNQKEGSYRVILIGIGENTEEEKESFCNKFSENYSVSFSHLKKIIDRCPIVIKKNLSLKKAEMLAKTLKSFGATVSIEEKEGSSPIFLEFQKMVPHQVALESAHLRKTLGGAWNVIGRIKNISGESLDDMWVLIQLFDDFEDFLTFEEIPIPINPLPAGESSPFKVVLEGDIPIHRVSIAFKNSSGNPLPAVDGRKTRSTHLPEPSEKISQHPEPKTPPLSIENSSEVGGEVGKKVPGEILVFGFGGGHLETIPETLEKNENLMLRIPEDVETQREEGLKMVLEDEPSQTSALSLLEEGREGEKASIELEFSPENYNDINDIREEGPFDVSLNEETPQSVDISLITERPKQEKPLFPWVEDFRKSIEIYYQEPRDIFHIWFVTQRKEGKFEDSLHSLSTILVHARFNQMNQTEKALENTQKVFRLILQPNLSLAEIPPLKGTPFPPDEIWRNLFLRAVPKIRQVADNILERKEWENLDLERLIQVIPHMSWENSRMSVRSIHELMPDAIEIDFSYTPIYIRESLYRVVSRLGVVNPHFDYYQGRDSMGDQKIQSFAKTAFPQEPIKIEEPMTRIGTREKGGHCFPTQPQCEGCHFETFCPRLYIHFNPSEKGMRNR